MTHQEIGSLGVSVHQAWNAAAAALRATALRGAGVEFSVRPASVRLTGAAPAGFEVRDGRGSTAAAWLAHPATFDVINRHFGCVLNTEAPLTYLSRDQRELFVFAVPEEEVVSSLGARGVMRYSLGFPLMVPIAPAMAANL
ncbi:hypothetical protein JKI95_10745 [Corynebacterium aquatimens]|uniref:hypothetical protein n=1 Tax=Corynebacterium TaxID=1716 RepID=UPI001F17C1A2|nr:MULTISPECIES: hypothetical protein [Corynebacterium]QYH19508.1 hypothetical protein JKI95_10745 [Corynebacterium aquatimens]UIZ91549.1 hypothetical protein JZY91_07240 [Corynebacterium sp. CNCTC7651]